LALGILTIDMAGGRTRCSLVYVGSPQSKEGDERKEEKMDLIIKMLIQKMVYYIERIRQSIQRNNIIR
jgi:hypothetical protein